MAALPDKSNAVIVTPYRGDRTARPASALLGGQRDIFRRGGPCPRRAAGDDPAYAIPPIVYGKSEEHLHFPGTLTLSGDTLLHAPAGDRRISLSRPVFASCR